MSRSLKRIVGIIDCFDTGETSLSLTTISERTGIDLATASRFLSALEAERMVRRDPVTKRYVLGSRLIQWGARAIDSVSIRSVAEPIMVKLRSASNETVALYVRDGDWRVCVATFESPQSVRHVLPIGRRLRITQAAGGRAMLAALPEHEARRIIQSDLLLSDAEREEIQRMLPSIRACGYPFGMHLTTQHAWSMGSPVFDRAGAVVAVLVVSGPDSRIDDGSTLRHATLLVPAARELSCALGAPPWIAQMRDDDTPYQDQEQVSTDGLSVPSLR